MDCVQAGIEMNIINRLFAWCSVGRHTLLTGLGSGAILLWCFSLKPVLLHELLDDRDIFENGALSLL